MQLSETTRDKIMVAAWEVFAEKGYDGARMQEIADRAGANKAMIFYYFSSKDALFEVLIKETFEKMLNSLQSLVADLSLGPKEVLPKIVHTHLSNLAANPNLPKILIREINSGNPVAQKVMAETLSEVGTSSTSPLLTFLQRNIEGGKIRQVDPVQTIWSLVALNLFYFIATPVVQAMWPDEAAGTEDILVKREKAVVDLLLYGLLPRKGEES